MLNRPFAYTDQPDNRVATATKRDPTLSIEDVSKVYKTPTGLHGAGRCQLYRL